MRSKGELVTATLDWFDIHPSALVILWLTLLALL